MKEYVAVLWQSTNDGVSEPAIGIQAFNDVFTLIQDGKEINVNYESIPALCRMLKTIKRPE